mmetsp:Transcript_9188/g.20663  ORF Transcript_9188/g.20663 Transcript_9188/m.20663 type:complete len:262 (-) Transcript_9188:205-990(-)
MVCMNPIGHLTIKWRGSELNFAYDGDTRVGALKTWLEGQTFVARSQQKLVGWQSRQGAAVGDSEAIASIRPARKLMLVGTPSDDLKMAGLDLERSRRTSRYVRDDLREWGSLGLPVQAYGGGRGRTRASSDCRPINAARGGGIFLDPEVWAPPTEEGQRVSGFILHPTSQALEPLQLSNALLRLGPGDRPGLDDGMEANRVARRDPINVDLMGQVRGRCNSCAQCTGYRRRDDAANENDTTVFRCATCGCESHLHEHLGAA